MRVGAAASGLQYNVDTATTTQRLIRNRLVLMTLQLGQKCPACQIHLLLVKSKALCLASLSLSLSHDYERVCTCKTRGIISGGSSEAPSKLPAPNHQQEAPR